MLGCLEALSAAINDPTTAVLAIDQLNRLLRLAGLRDLRGEEIYDANGELRLIFRTPNACVRCWRISCLPYRSIGTPSCASN
jgi:uncharacterized membrane protein